MARLTNIDRLKATTTEDLSKMKMSELRRFVERQSKSVYDQFRKTELAIQNSNGKIRSKFIEDRAKGGVQDKYRIRRINASSTNKMNRRQLEREVQNLKYAVNQKTFTIEGSKEYTATLNRLGVNYDKLQQTTTTDWSKLRQAMELYNSEEVIEEYGRQGSVDETIDALYENHEMNLDYEEDIDAFDAIKDEGIDPFI